MATGEYVQHYHIVRLSVLGSGNLRQTMLSLPNNNGVQREQALVPVNLDALGRYPSNSLANFKEFAAQLKIETTDIDEYFIITRILVFKLPTETGIPG